MRISEHVGFPAWKGIVLELLRKGSTFNDEMVVSPKFAREYGWAENHVSG